MAVTDSDPTLPDASALGEHAIKPVMLQFGIVREAAQQHRLADQLGPPDEQGLQDRSAQRPADGAHRSQPQFSEDGGDVFVHSSVLPAGVDALKPGQRVE